MVHKVHSQITTLCSALVPDSVALVDALSPPDFVLDSALGHSSGQVSMIPCSGVQ